MSTSQLFERASIHGRFQPFHNEHLDYARRAFACANFIYVGITQYRLSALNRSDDSSTDHRSQPRNNPMSYFERCELIRTVLLADGYSADRFCLTPFPIESPHELLEFLAVDIPALTTHVDEWSEEKVRRLETIGYSTVTLVTRDPKAVSGSEIRALMVAGDPAWKRSVPAEAARLLDDWRIPSRLRLIVNGP